MQARELFDFPESLAVFAPWFDLSAPVWEWLAQITPALDAVFAAKAPELPPLPPGVHVEGPVHLEPGVRLPHMATLIGPAWIGADCEIRPGAFVRGHVIVGRGCVLGNASEYKNCMLFDEVETPHYNYVGDSILGNRAHLGAGVICANLKLARDEVIVHIGPNRYRTGRHKVGAFLGDGAEAGCNSVLQPGTVLGRRAAVISMPFHGYLPPNTIALPDYGRRTLKRP
jgi:NDP-sugar pyrophosphorylase family protein